MTKQGGTVPCKMNALTYIQTFQHMQPGARPSLYMRKIYGRSLAEHPRLAAPYSRSGKGNGVQSPEHQR